LGSERTVAAPEKDRHVVRATIRDGQVRQTVGVEIADRARLGTITDLNLRIKEERAWGAEACCVAPREDKKRGSSPKSDQSLEAGWSRS